MDRQEFAEQLALRGLRQQDVAELAGLSEAVVSSAARGKAISGPTFARIAAALAAAPVVAPEAGRLLAREDAAYGTAAGVGTSAAVEEAGRAATNIQRPA